MKARQGGMAKRRRYTDEFRASAVLMLEAAGYPGTEGALSRVAEHLGLHYQTLSRWARGINNAPPNEIVQEKKEIFLQQLQAIKGVAASKILDRIEEFEPRDLTGLLKISAELAQLMEGKPTEIVDDSRITDAERTERVAAIFERARARRDGLVARTEENAASSKLQ